MLILVGLSVWGVGRWIWRLAFNRTTPDNTPAPQSSEVITEYDAPQLAIWQRALAATGLVTFDVVDGRTESRWPDKVRSAHASQLDDLNQRVGRLEEFTERINADLWNLDFNDRTGAQPSVSDILARLEYVEDVLADDTRSTPVRDHPRPPAQGVQTRSTASTGVPSTAASTVDRVTIDRYSDVAQRLLKGQSWDDITKQVGVSKATVKAISEGIKPAFAEVE